MRFFCCKYGFEITLKDFYIAFKLLNKKKFRL